MTRRVKNILFIMFDQLRFDYLSCAGHPHLHTPNMDWLASQGVRFSRAYVQSPVCGSSRMSCYTGRYVHSHGPARFCVWRSSAGSSNGPLRFDRDVPGRAERLRVHAPG